MAILGFDGGRTLSGTGALVSRLTPVNALRVVVVAQEHRKINSDFILTPILSLSFQTKVKFSSYRQLGRVSKVKLAAITLTVSSSR